MNNQVKFLKNKVKTFICCGLLCAATITANAQVVGSGSCGTNLTWALTDVRPMQVEKA